MSYIILSYQNNIISKDLAMKIKTQLIIFLSFIISGFIFFTGCNIVGQLIDPDAPSNLGVISVTDTSIQIGWIDNSTNESSFNIERKITADGSWVQIVQVGEGVSQYTDNGLTPNTKYYYRIRASNDAGFSSYTNEVSIYTLSGSGNKLPTVTITSPFDQATVSTNFNIQFLVEDWDVESGEGKPTHLHWFLNGVDKGSWYQTTPIPVTNLTPGFYTITLKLANRDHEFIGVEDTIEVTVAQ